MKFTIEIPDDQFTEVLTAISSRRGWQAKITDGGLGEIANPKTREDVLYETIVGFFEDEVTAYRASQLSPIKRAKIEVIKQ